MTDHISDDRLNELEHNTRVYGAPKGDIALALIAELRAARAAIERVTSRAETVERTFTKSKTYTERTVRS